MCLSGFTISALAFVTHKHGIKLRWPSRADAAGSSHYPPVGHFILPLNSKKT
jgi:hypothetical protein